MRGGKREGAGRKPGSRNKVTAAREAAIRAAAEKVALLIPDAFDGDAHAFLMMVYKDPSLPVELRLDAAGKAIRFEKPALAAVHPLPVEPGTTMAPRMPNPRQVDEIVNRFVVARQKLDG
jgi:hypothetical protein